MGLLALMSALSTLLWVAPSAHAAYVFVDKDVVNAKTAKARFYGNRTVNGANGGEVRWWRDDSSNGPKRGEFMAHTYAQVRRGENPLCIAARVRWDKITAQVSFSLPAGASLTPGLQRLDSGFLVSCRRKGSATPARPVSLDGVSHSSRLLLRVHADVCHKANATSMWSCATDSNAYGDGERSTRDTDVTAPVLAKPVASLASPTSRTANYSITATDDSGAIAEMRVKATGDAAWRPWVPFAATGTVILPNRYGDFNIWFQVKDAAGNVSSQRATDILTRVQDLGAPVVTGAGLGHGDPASRYVQYSLGASDALSPVTQMRVLVSGEDWRPWVSYSPNGTVVLPDGYGRFGVTFQVMDSAGNVSAPHFAGVVTRTAPVSLALHQIDNSGNIRSCGSEAQPCTDVVKRFRVNISSPVLPRTDLLFKAWRNVNGVWVETSTSPFLRLGITGSTIDFGISANLLAGVWRFQAQVPRDVDGITDFAASGYQFLRIG